MLFIGAHIHHFHNLAAELKRILKCDEEQDDTFVKQSILLDLLNLTDADKSRLTRAVRNSFPKSRKKIITLDQQKMYPLNDSNVWN